MLAIAVVLALLFPQLETVVRRQSVDLIPRDVPSFQTVDRMSAAFGEQGSKTMLFVAMESPRWADAAGAGSILEARRAPSSRSRPRAAGAGLAGRSRDEGTSRQRRRQSVVPTGGGVAGTLGDPTAAESVQAVRATAQRAFDGSDITVRVTGPPGNLQ